AAQISSARNGDLPARKIISANFAPHYSGGNADGPLRDFLDRKKRRHGRCMVLGTPTSGGSMKPTSFIAAAILVTTLSAAHAGEAVDAVRPFYTNVVFEADPEFRDKFVDPAKAKFEEYDKSSSDSDEVGCIDGILSVDAQDYDEAVLAKTLQLTEK